jgi:hypothetical protein
MVCPAHDRLSGTVEVDVMDISGKKPGRHGHCGQQGRILVVIAAEDKCGCLGRIRLRRVAGNSAAVLTEAMKGMVEQGSVVRTDGWGGYVSLCSEDYKHAIVRPSRDNAKNCLPLAYRLAVLLKCWIAGTHQGAVRKSHIDYYLDEFTFRFNQREALSHGRLFYRLVQQAVAIAPLRGQDIYSGSFAPGYHKTTVTGVKRIP